MTKYRSFLIDLDGTVYRGDQTIPTGSEFVQRLQKEQFDYVFLTNNTTRTPQMVVDKLKTHGITTDVAHVYTPCLACMSSLEQHYPQQKPYHVSLIGQIGLKSAFW